MFVLYSSWVGTSTNNIPGTNYKNPLDFCGNGHISLPGLLSLCVGCGRFNGVSSNPIYSTRRVARNVYSTIYLPYCVRARPLCVVAQGSLLIVSPPVDFSCGRYIRVSEAVSRWCRIKHIITSSRRASCCWCSSDEQIHRKCMYE